MKRLPNIMIAPNGARRTKLDHPMLPVTIPEIVDTAAACWNAGADGLHLHIRDKDGRHTLDSGLYKEAIKELSKALPNMYVQITTEAVGQYSPEEQRKVVKDVLPLSASISISEMLRNKDYATALEFYRWCDEAGVSVQHILYNEQDLSTLKYLLKEHKSFSTPLHLLFVMGRHTKNQQSHPNDLKLYTDWLMNNEINADWAACAFGQSETDCLLATYRAGGKIRVGFENSLWNTNGVLAVNNKERVIEVKAAIDAST